MKFVLICLKRSVHRFVNSHLCLANSYGELAMLLKIDAINLSSKFPSSSKGCRNCLAHSMNCCIDQYTPKTHRKPPCSLQFSTNDFPLIVDRRHRLKLQCQHRKKFRYNLWVGSSTSLNNWQSASGALRIKTIGSKLLENVCVLFAHLHRIFRFF